MGKSSKHESRKKSTKQQQKADTERQAVASIDFKYYAFVGTLAIFFGYLSSQHVIGMFERQKHFSHLSTLERELSFRTEMGLYYSYYKTIAEASSWMGGVSQILSCNVTEYPDHVNVLRRFNLYPELVLGSMFRVYKWLGRTFDWKIQTCYTINRGDGLSQVQSCEGMGDIAHFYVFPIFWLNGMMMTLFFILGTYLSGNALGGLMAVASYFYNFGEATRVQWTPPLRESFSFPFLVAQLLTVVHLIKCPSPSNKHSILLAFVTTLFMLPWQFAQFALLTQVCALLGLYMLKFIDSHRITVILKGLLLSHLVNFLAQFGNTLLISSFFMAAMVAAFIVVKMDATAERMPHRIITWIFQIGSFLVLLIVIKVGTAKLFQIKDDAHIFDILKSKFTDFKDFHTLLYVCAAEFDFIGFEYFKILSKTFLVPLAVLAAVVLLVKLAINEWRFWIRCEKITEQIVCPVKPFAEHFYWLLQTIAFVIMATLIMRLKLFSTPALCILSSFIASRQLFGFVGKKSLHFGLVFLALAFMSNEGYRNVMIQIKQTGSFSNVPMEMMIEWVNTRTNPGDVFAGAMPTMAAIKLSCGRPIVNHPHYEDADLRARTKRVYQLYSRKSAAFYHQEMLDMKVTYVIMEESWCRKRSRQGCALPEVWDIEDPSNRSKPPLCEVLRDKPHPFQVVFKNSGYKILRV